MGFDPIVLIIAGANTSEHQQGVSTALYPQKASFQSQAKGQSLCPLLLYTIPAVQGISFT